MGETPMLQKVAAAKITGVCSTHPRLTSNNSVFDNPVVAALSQDLARRAFLPVARASRPCRMYIGAALARRHGRDAHATEGRRCEKNTQPQTVSRRLTPLPTAYMLTLLSDTRMRLRMAKRESGLNASV